MHPPETLYNIFETLVILPFPAWTMAIMYLVPSLSTKSSSSAIAVMFFATSVLIAAKPPTRYLTNIALCIELSVLSMVLIVKEYYLPPDNRIRGEPEVFCIYVMIHDTDNSKSRNRPH